MGVSGVSWPSATRQYRRRDECVASIYDQSTLLLAGNNPELARGRWQVEYRLDSNSTAHVSAGSHAPGRCFLDQGEARGSFQSDEPARRAILVGGGATVVRFG